MNLGQPVFSEAKDDGSGGDNWSYKSCKAPVKSSSPTNQHQVFSPGRMPFLSPNQQCQSTEGENITALLQWWFTTKRRCINCMYLCLTFYLYPIDFLTPNSPGGLLTLSMTTNSSWLPWLPCLSWALWCSTQLCSDEASVDMRCRHKLAWAHNSYSDSLSYLQAYRVRRLFMSWLMCGFFGIMEPGWCRQVLKLVFGGWVAGVWWLYTCFHSVLAPVL